MLLQGEKKEYKSKWMRVTVQIFSVREMTTQRNAFRTKKIESLFSLSVGINGCRKKNPRHHYKSIFY
jgi:hypothetical protein